ncbi:MAG: aminoacyl-tRNA hydrolase [Legionellales bacterium]|nr:aminoacyl-tRNA hydrolase [Legionellales bacterium]
MFRVDKKMHGEVGQLDFNGLSCKMLRPLVFMNHNGTSVCELSRFYAFKPDELLVAHDDLDLSVGRIKLKTGGGHGGHNGLRDLIQQLGHSDFHRLRIGIGHPGHKDLVLNYVLSKPSSLDRQLIDDALSRGMAILPMLLAGDVMKAMSQLNGE